MDKRIICSSKEDTLISINEYINLKIRKFYRLLAFLTILVVGCFFLVQCKVANDHKIAKILLEIHPALRVLYESKELGYQSKYQELQAHLKNKYKLKDIKILPKHQLRCTFPTYQLNGYDMCWDFVDISATRRVDYMISDQILVMNFDTTWLRSEVIYSVLFLIFCFILIAAILVKFSFVSFRKELVDPLLNINTCVLSNQPCQYPGEIYEIFNLSKVLNFSQDKINYRIKFESLRTIAHDLKKPTLYAYNFAKRFHSLRSSKRKGYVNKNLLLLKSHVLSSSIMLENLMESGSNPKLRFDDVRIWELLQFIERYFNKGLEVEYPSDPNFKVYLDKQKILRTLNNLILNALEASQKVSGAKVALKVFKANKYAVFSILNTKSSLSKPEILTFSRSYAKLNQLCSRGMGLSIAHSFVHAHGGRLVFESNGFRSDGEKCTILNESYVKCEVRLPLKKIGQQASLG